MDLSLLFLGTGGVTPTNYRGLPATLLTRGGEKILFDCGEGTQRQLVRSGGLPDINAIYLTHFHADHWLGLPGMLKSFSLRDRETPLYIYGPSGLKSIMEQAKFMYGSPSYPLHINELAPYERVSYKGYHISAIPVVHGTKSAVAYCLLEDDRPGHLDANLAKQLGVTPGPDFGRLQRGETVNGVTPQEVMGETRRSRKILFSGDTSPCKELEKTATDADILIHEATFLEDEKDRADSIGHSTANGAATLARQANVKALFLNHISNRYIERDIRKEAQDAFPSAEILRDFDVVDVPFPEDGPPRLVRSKR